MIITLWASLFIISVISPNLMLASGQAEQPIFSENANLIQSWLIADAIAIDNINNPSAKGTDQVTSQGLPFRVKTGGYKLFKTEDLGRVLLDKRNEDIVQELEDGSSLTTPTEIQEYGFRKRYHIEFTVLIRTLATPALAIGSITEGTQRITYSRLYQQLVYWNDWELHADADATFRKVNIPNTWRSNAEKMYSGSVFIRLSMNPQWDMDKSWSDSDGQYNFGGIWAGFSEVRTHDSINADTLKAGLIKDNVQILTETGGTAGDESEVDDSVTSEAKPASSNSEVSLKLAQSGHKSSDVVASDTSGAIADEIYNSPNDPFDMFLLDTSKLDFQFDKEVVKSGNSNTRIYFPYNFNMRPEVEILNVKHKFHTADVYENTGIFGGYDHEVANPNYETTIRTGYAVNNVFTKQKLIGSIDIVSKYEFTPTIPGRPPLNDPTQYTTNTTFNGVKIGDTGPIQYDPADPWGLGGIGDTIANLVDTLLTIGIIALVGIVSFVVINRIVKNRRKAKIQERLVKKDLNI